MKTIQSWSLECAVMSFLLMTPQQTGAEHQTWFDTSSVLRLPHIARNRPLTERDAPYHDSSKRRHHSSRRINATNPSYAQRAALASRSTKTEGPHRNPAQPLLTAPALPQYSWGNVSRATRNNQTVANEAVLPVDEPEDLEWDSDEQMGRLYNQELPESGEGDEEEEGGILQGLPHERFWQSPVVYRYFGRSRSRLHTADSIPFVLLGPCVDHWKTTGETLASRGFNVMAIELVEEKDRDRSYRQQGSPEDGKDLILAVLDALRWNRAILVGCDNEASLAIQAAIHLAPDRIAGLVICGNIASAYSLANRLSRSDPEHRPAKSQGNGAIESFLGENLKCPYTIIWDGDEVQSSKMRTTGGIDGTSPGDMSGLHRCLILGGGTAPHRRLPEQFAWVLTRFVEEKIAPLPTNLYLGDVSSAEDQATKATHDAKRRDKLPFALDEIFSPGSLLVVGRVLATAIFYATAMKVAMYQYENVRGGMLGIHSVIQWVASGQQRIIRSVTAFVKHYGYVFSLVGRIFLPKGERRSSDTDVEFDDQIGELQTKEDSDKHMDDEHDDVSEQAVGEENGTDTDPHADHLKEDENRGFQRPMLLDQVIV